MRLIPLLFFSCSFLGSAFGEDKPIKDPIKDPFSLDAPSPEVFDQSNFLGEFFYMLLMLSILISLVYFLAWFMRRMTTVRIDQYNDQSEMKILERRQISQRTTLYLMEVEGKKIIMAESPTSVVQLNLHQENH